MENDKKIIKYDEIFQYANEISSRILIKDLPLEKFLPDDVFYFSEVGIIVWRPRLETDEEYQERMVSNQKMEKRNREDRYRNYLVLKAEFEGN